MLYFPTERLTLYKETSVSEDVKYENIAVLTPTKQRFIKKYKAAKKGRRQFYIDNYLNELMDKDES